MISVYIIIVSHKYGQSIVGHATTAGAARRGLASYCRWWWQHEQVPGDTPDNDDELIEQYFNHTEGYESFTAFDPVPLVTK